MQNDDDKPHMGRPPLPEDKRAGSFIQLRVKRERKAAYVRAAQRRAKKPKTLAAWCFEHLDKASGYTEPTQ
jgi:hypothetical protein